MSMFRTLSRRALIGVAGLGAAGAALTGISRSRGQEAAERAEAAYPPIGRFVSVDGVKIHLVDTGPTEASAPNAPAIVLIHGASGNLRDFTFDFVKRLTPRLRVIAIDRPGFGHSERGPGQTATEPAHHPAAQARLMREAVKAIGVARAVLVGHSLGGASALAWLVDAPETVIGLVDLAGVSHPWPGSAGLVYDLGVSVLGGLTADLIAGLVSEEQAIAGVNSIFRPQAAPEGYAEYVGVALALRPSTVRYNNRDIGLLKPLLETQRLAYPEIAAPIEILHGEADTIVKVSVHGERLAREAPTAELTVLPGVGHMPHHAAPEACLAAIERVLARAG